MKKKKPIKKLYNKYHPLPPLFPEDFRDIGPKWTNIGKIDFDKTGRVLTCHLLIDHYLTNLLSLLSPPDFNWKNSRLTFSQKLCLIEKVKSFNDNGLIKGIKIINEIRNSYSHNLLATIDKKKVSALLSIVKESKDNTKYEIIFDQFDDLAVIELFTHFVCAFIAGYCTANVDIEKGRVKISRAKNKLTKNDNGQ